MQVTNKDDTIVPSRSCSSASPLRGRPRPGLVRPVSLPSTCSATAHVGALTPAFNLADNSLCMPTDVYEGSMSTYVHDVVMAAKRPATRHAAHSSTAVAHPSRPASQRVLRSRKEKHTGTII